MNNEEKIIAMLGTLMEKVEQHGEMLETLTEKVEQHGEMLKEIDTRSIKTAVLLETEVARDVHLLYKGHETILDKLDTLAEKSRVEALEADMTMMKDAYKLLRQEVNELKKAQ